MSYKSPDLSQLIRGKYLSDKKILQYIREGRYGEDRQRRQLEIDKGKKKPKKPSKTSPALAYTEYLISVLKDA